MESDVDDVPFLGLRSMDVTEVLHAILGVHVDIHLERLTKGLYLLRSSPDTSFSRLRHFGIEASLLIFGGRWGGGSRAGRPMGRVLGSRGGGAPRSATLTPDGSNEVHKVFFVGTDMIGETDTDILGMTEVTEHLVGEGVVEAVPYVRGLVRNSYHPRDRGPHWRERRALPSPSVGRA